MNPYKPPELLVKDIFETATLILVHAQAAGGGDDEGNSSLRCLLCRTLLNRAQMSYTGSCHSHFEAEAAAAKEAAAAAAKELAQLQARLMSPWWIMGSRAVSA